VMDEPPQLRIVVLSYNTRDLLADCLESVLADPEAAAWRVVVVDNASTDGSAEMVRERFPTVQLVVAKENRGFSAGNNAGSGGREPFLLFLNSDTVVPAGAIGGLQSALQSRPEHGAVGPRLVNPDGSVQWSCRTFPGPLNTLLEGFWLERLLPRSRFFGRPRLTWLDHTLSADVEYVAGAALLVRREAFEAAGRWPEAYYFYGEDADLCRSVRQLGWRIGFVGEVSITHLGGGSTGTKWGPMTVEAHRSVLRFALRSGGPVRLLLQRLATVAVALPRLLLALAAPRGEQAAARRRALLGVLRAALSPLPPAQRQREDGP